MEQPDTDKYFKKITARHANITINLFLCGLFAFASLYTENWLATALMAWSSGAQFGFATMWWISPHITERWRRETQSEIDLMVSRAMLQAMRDGGMVMWESPPTSPDEPPPTSRWQ